MLKDSNLKSELWTLSVNCLGQYLSIKFWGVAKIADSTRSAVECRLEDCNTFQTAFQLELHHMNHEIKQIGSNKLVLVTQNCNESKFKKAANFSYRIAQVHCFRTRCVPWPVADLVAEQGTAVDLQMFARGNRGIS